MSFGRFAATVVALSVAGCGGGTTHTTTPTPTSGPPAITCPTAQSTETLTGDPVVVNYPAPTVSDGQAPVTTTCTPGSGTTFGVGQTSVSCVARDARSREATCSFDVTVLPPPQLSATKFAAFGDSITLGEDGTVGPSSIGDPLRIFPQVLVANPYPAVLQSLLRARYVAQGPSVANQGNRGEELADPIALVPNADTLGRFSSVARGPYDVILLMEGSNDANESGKDSRVRPVAIEALRQMILDAKSRGRKPFLATIPPMNPAGFRGVNGAAVVPDFNSDIRNLAAAQGIPLVDVYAAFNGNLNLLASDGMHPNPDGYDLMAHTFFDAIVKDLEQPRTTASGIRFRK